MPTEGTPGSLIVSLSGLQTSTLDDADAFVRALDVQGVPVSLLVAPRRGQDYRLQEDPATQEWMRQRRAFGDAIVLNGYDRAATKRYRAEFAVIPEREALLRLTAADRHLAEMGLRTRLFAPPRWIASPGAIAALPKVGFTLCADLTSVRNLDAGTAFDSRVLGVGDGFLADKWWCKALGTAALRTARRGGVVRLNIAARHLRKRPVRSALAGTVSACLDEGLIPDCYRCPRDNRVGLAA